MSKRLPVIFRTFRKEGDVIALFPTIPARCSSWYDCESYQHIGQHGPADTGIVYTTRQATAKEAATLRRELESKPYSYRLKRYRRIAAWMDRAREKAWREYRDRLVSKATEKVA